MEALFLRGSRAVLEIEGMRTVHCIRGVFQALAGVPGIGRADVSLGRAEVDLEADVIRAQLAAAVELAGYTLRDAYAAPRTLPIFGG